MNFEKLYNQKEEIFNDLKKLPVKEKKFTGNLGDYVVSSYTGMLPPKLRMGEYLDASTGWAYACISVIADELANIDFHLYQRKGEDMQEIFNHPVLDLLYKANSFTTKFDLFWLSAQYLETTGEAPWFLKIENKLPTDILLLRPDRITTIEAKDDRIVAGYSYQVGSKTITIDPNEIIFLRYPAPLSYLRGRGTMEAAAKTIDIDNFSEDFNKNFFYNAAVPNAVLKTDNNLTDAQRERLKKSLEQNYAGKNNAHKTILLENGLDWKPMVITQKDMDFLEQQRFSRDKILGIFRVPKTALGLTEDVNRANAEATDYVFSKRTIRPKMQRIIEQLNEFLLPLYPDGKNLVLDFTDPVPENQEEKLRYYESGLQNFWLTINDVRGKEGLDVFKKVGDRLYMPFSLMPVSTTQNDNIPPAEEEPVTEENKLLNKIKRRNIENIKDYQKNVIGKILEKEVEKKAKEILNNSKKAKELVDNSKKELIKETIVKEDENRQIPYSIKENFWKMLVTKALAEEKKFINEMNIIFGNQAKKVKGNLENKAGVGKYLLDNDEETDIMVKIFMPIINEIIKEHGQDAIDLLGLDKEFSNNTETIVKFLKKRIFNFSFEVTKETNYLLGKTLAEGVSEGEGTPKLKKRVEQLFTDFESYRSERIARSEVIRASNFATEEGYKQSGVVKAKEWLTAEDERTCEWCAPLNGKVIGLGKSYFDKGDTYSGQDGNDIDLDYEDIEHPPLHPNCRCTLIPVVGKSIIDWQAGRLSLERKAGMMDFYNELNEEIAIFKNNTDKKLDNIEKGIDKILSE